MFFSQAELEEMWRFVPTSGSDGTGFFFVLFFKILYFFPSFAFFSDQVALMSLPLAVKNPPSFLQQLKIFISI